MPGDTVYPIEAVTVYAASGARVAKKFTDHAYELGAVRLRGHTSNIQKLFP